MLRRQSVLKAGPIEPAPEEALADGPGRTAGLTT